MKKVFMSAAVVAMMVAAVEANCEKACCDSTKTLKDAVEGAAKDVKDAATDAAVKAVDEAADPVKDAIK